MLNRQLVYAVKLAEMGSFRRAAEVLNISHAALVHSIRTIEEHYGLRLFDRGRGVKATPTEIGEVFLKRARQILHLERDLDYDLQRIKEAGVGVLNIALAPFPQRIFGQVVVGRMLTRFPALQVKVTLRQYTQVVDIVLNREADLAIADLNNRSVSAEFDTERLPPHVSVFICRRGHPLVGRKDLTIADVLNFPWCTTRLPSRFKDFIPVDLGRAGSIDPLTLEFVPAIEVENLWGLKELIEQSDILGGVPLITFAEELRAGSVAVVPFHQPWMVTGYGFISLKNRYKPPAVQIFMDEVRSVEKVLVEAERELIGAYLPCASVTAGAA